MQESKVEERPRERVDEQIRGARLLYQPRVNPIAALIAEAFVAPRPWWVDYSRRSTAKGWSPDDTLRDWTWDTPKPRVHNTGEHHRQPMRIMISGYRPLCCPPFSFGSSCSHSIDRVHVVSQEPEKNERGQERLTLCPLNNLDLNDPIHFHRKIH